MDTPTTFPVRHPVKTVGTVAAATILGALAIEQAGYPPCTLCLYQRVPYYAICVLMLTAAAFGRTTFAKRVYGPFLLLLVVLLAVSAGLGVFHAGVEFSLWDGPSGCSGRLDSSSMESLLESLKHTKAVSCTKASFWIFGLSLSVWNTIVSVVLGGIVALALRFDRR